MPAREPTVQTIKATEVRTRWSEILDQVFRRQTRVIVEKSGIPVAAIISADDLDQFQQWKAQRSERFKILDEIGAAFKDLPDEDVEREVARAIKEMRAENRQASGPTR